MPDDSRKGTKCSNRLLKRSGSVNRLFRSLIGSFVLFIWEGAERFVFSQVFTLERIYDSWTLQRLTRHLVYWLAWLLFYSAANSSYHEEPIWTWMEVELVIMPTKMLYVYTVIYVLLPRYLIKKEYGRFIFWTLLLAVAGGLLLRLVDNYIIGPHILGTSLYGSFWHPKIVYKFLDLVYVASLPAIIKLVQGYLHQEKQHQELKAEKLGAELQLLRNQLQPHFLFNTLNNLYGMVLSQHPQAADVVMRLSDMMSYMLYECNDETIALEKEIGQLRNYIELEKIRYGERLEVSFETAGAVAGQRISPLLLIAFWENAFKHGPAKDERPCWISGNLWVDGPVLHFTLENSLPDHPEEGSIHTGGIGLKNVQKRLDLVYPGRYQLQIRHDETYFVNLQIKLS